MENARGYDAAAEHVHPHYREVQEVILDAMAPVILESSLVVDLGGGSGRLAERILERWPTVRVCVLDQSDAFLAIAGERLARFQDRASFHCARLQSDWCQSLPDAPRALISMSAIHHLDPAEKARLYRQCADCLADGGVLLNGDEVRPERDDDYLDACRRWATHMHRVMDSGLVPEMLHSALRGWESRNVGQFGTPRVSGDDCHETAATQLGYFHAAGLVETRVLWQRELWAVLAGRKKS